MKTEGQERKSQIYLVWLEKDLILPYLNKMLCWKYPSSLLRIILEWEIEEEWEFTMTEAWKGFSK